MRSKRMHTYKKKFRYVILFGKVVLMWYLVVFSISYITTSDTTADFTDLREAKGMIYAAGDWTVVDESAFEFIEEEKDEWHTCESKNIKAELKNNGEEDMQDTSSYDVYYSKTGDPKDGKKMDLTEKEGTIPTLEKGESTKLTFNASKPGHYKFVAYQLDEDGTKVWSDTIIMTCDANAKQDKNEQPEEQSEDTTNEQDASSQESTSDDEETDASTNDENDKAEDSKDNDDTSSKEDNHEDENDNAASSKNRSSDDSSGSSSGKSSEAAENDTDKGEVKDEKDDKQ